MKRCQTLNYNLSSYFSSQLYPIHFSKLTTLMKKEKKNNSWLVEIQTHVRFYSKEKDKKSNNKTATSLKTNEKTKQNKY